MNRIVVKHISLITGILQEEYMSTIECGSVLPFHFSELH